MLSRLAESLFWIGRYVERAENTTRLLDVHTHAVLEDSPVDVDTACRTLLAVFGVPSEAEEVTVADVLEELAFNPSSPASVAQCVTAARENARGARDTISSEMFSCLNRVYNRLPAEIEGARRSGPDPFFAWMRSATAEFQGLADSTMSRDEGWHFLVLGRSLERIDVTARLISIRVGAGAAEGPGPAGGTFAPTGPIPPWVTLLRSCAAYESHLRTCRGVLEPARVAQFLLLDRLFPRSIFATLLTAEGSLAALQPSLGRAGVTDEARRVLGKARADLEFTRPQELVARMPTQLLALQTAVDQVSSAVARRYFQGEAPLAWHQEATA